MEGKVCLNDAMIETMLQRTVNGERKRLTRSPFDSLANRELAVFRLNGQGEKASEIAKQLHLSIKNVETCRNRSREKLDLSNETELAHYATKWVLEIGE